ncbi:MFS transporter, ceroid-lipofuscinosis neuronal protein 7 [Paragonimus westermani]|uniref:MFS transporter, ceroid-lipofuscinosis neuronal protein 7 n=1 Tax=Paragonimus westermani TaxID=34504 RepID=A0A5J4NPS7_9TREM|nr:MFS transporter, ceroid-lipofuscinosis neuronal protein 7 [Paragonimus westermani]
MNSGGGCVSSTCSPKRLQILVGSIWGFLTNVERAIIMPSLWLYLRNTWNENAATKFYGAIVAAFSLAILLFTPVVGWAAYKGVRTHVLLLVSNQLEILGNIMYLVGRSPWVLLFGRFISGVGACCDPPLYADMIKLTDQKERTSYVIAMLLPRQAGLLFGPAFTILVHKLNVNVGNFNINVYNVPGLLMAGLWGVHCILILVAYPNVERITNEAYTPTGELTPASRMKRYFFQPKRSKASMTEVSKIILNDSAEKSIHTEDSVFLGGVICSPCCANHPKCTPYLLYTSLALITLYCIIFMIYFSVLCLEAVLPPVAERLYQWSEVEISIVYLCSGALILLIYFLYVCINQYVTDRMMLTVGMVILLFSYVWQACYLAYQPVPSRTVGIALMMTGVFLHVLGTPMVATSCESLYTKIAPESDSDRAQTVFRTVLNVGYFTGPYIGGSLVSIPYAAFLLMMMMVFVPFVLLCLVYSAFRVAKEA